MTLVLDKKIYSHDEQRGELIYHKEKKVRGNSFSIFSNKVIELKGKLSKSNELTIPKDLFRWVNLKKSPLVLNVKLKSQIKITDYIDTQIELRKNAYGNYIRNLSNHYFTMGEQVQYQIRLDEFFSPTSLYYKAIELLDNIKLPPPNSIELLFKGGKGKRKFEIYKDSRNILYIKAKGMLKDGGSISLSGEFGYYIKDWFKNTHLVFASKDKEQAIVLESRIIRKDSSRSPEKCIYFPYHGKRKSISFIFSSHEFQLTERALQDLNIKQALVDRGIPISRFKSHSLIIGNHCDSKYETKIRKLTQQISTNQDWINFPEVYVEFNIPNDNNMGNSKIVDNIITERNLQSILLIEIKTSEKHLGSELECAITDLLHTKSKFNRDYVYPLLFINQDIKRLNKSLILTENYGLSCGIILIGLEKISSLQYSPQKLLQIMIDFSKKQKLLSKKNSMLVHPVSGEITTNKHLKKEAYNLLANSNVSRNSLISRYCLLMGITITDFWLLYNHHEKLVNKNQKLNQNDLGILQDAIDEPLTLSIFDILHNLLVEENYFALLSLKSKLPQNYDLKILIRNQQLILEKFPACVKIHDIKKRKKGKGITYEREIRDRLIENGYQVASNVILSNLSKPFEVDHIAFKDNKITLVSCKDRSNISYEPELPHLIKEAANTLEFRKNLLNADKAVLYVKVNKTFRENQQNLFGEIPWVENVEIRID
ncbi:MAG: hypothetical protein HZR80_02575 [Candidatus Heimdallarchaeota archaeon]